MNQHTNKLKRRFNIIDIVILLALLAIVTFAANYIANDMFSKELVTVEYYLRIQGVSERDAAKLSVNDAVSANTSGTTLGKIREITVTDEKEAVFNSETGRYVYAPVPGKKNGILTRQRGLHLQRSQLSYRRLRDFRRNISGYSSAVFL